MYNNVHLYIYMVTCSLVTCTTMYMEACYSPLRENPFFSDSVFKLIAPLSADCKCCTYMYICGAFGNILESQNTEKRVYCTEIQAIRLDGSTVHTDVHVFVLHVSNLLIYYYKPILYQLLQIRFITAGTVVLLGIHPDT